MQDLDGWEAVNQPPHRRFHLDVFVDESLARLSHYLGANSIAEAIEKGLILNLTSVRELQRQMNIR